MSKFYMVESFYRGETEIYEFSPTHADKESVMKDLERGQYTAGPVTRIIEVDLDSNTSRDVSREWADEIVERHQANPTDFDPPAEVWEFVRNNRTPMRRSA